MTSEAHHPAQPTHRTTEVPSREVAASHDDMKSSPRQEKTIPPLPIGDRNANPPGMTLWQLIREDYNANGRKILRQGFLVLALHRFGNWRMGIRKRILRLPFTAVYRFAYPFTEYLCGIKLSHTVKVGRRVTIEHFGGMVLGARSIGDDCTIRQNTTFGIARKDEPNGKPIIEDRVDIGAGACLLGHIRIGHDSVIGANAVVVRDVPPWSVVVGVPGKIIKTREPDHSAASGHQTCDASDIAPLNSEQAPHDERDPEVTS